jgi:hypothetical protein
VPSTLSPTPRGLRGVFVFLSSLFLTAVSR